jgi:hypothetical protein
MTWWAYRHDPIFRDMERRIHGSSVSITEPYSRSPKRREPAHDRLVTPASGRPASPSTVRPPIHMINNPSSHRDRSWAATHTVNSACE